MLLARATPAIPHILGPISKRIEHVIDTTLPHSGDEWCPVVMLDPLLACITQVISLPSFGEELCDDERLIAFCKEHAINGQSAQSMKEARAKARLLSFHHHFYHASASTFSATSFGMDSPQKWRLENQMRLLQKIIVPEIRRRCGEHDKDKTNPEKSDFISWLLIEGKKEEIDPAVLIRFIGAIIAGGTWSTAGFILGALLDIINSPDLLVKIREEIKAKNVEIIIQHGAWDQLALNSLDTLDSAMKETGRLRTATVFVYSRVMQEDYVTLEGLLLKKGQFIITSSHSTARDPSKFSSPCEYDGLRFLKEDLDSHRAQPCRTVEPTGYRWGSGRWACPGRYIASLATKIILVKLLDEYDFKFPDGQMPRSSAIHEFSFMKPGVKLMVKRREENSAISF